MCKTKIKVKNNVCVDQANDHTHAPDADKTEALVVRQRMKRHVENFEKPLQQIRTMCVQGIDEIVSTQLPPPRHVRRTLRIQRRRIGNPL